MIALGSENPVKLKPELRLVLPSVAIRPLSPTLNVGANNVAGALASNVTIKGLERRLTLPASSVAMIVKIRVVLL